MDSIGFNSDEPAHNAYAYAKNLVYKLANANIPSLIFHNHNIIMLYVKR